MIGVGSDQSALERPVVLSQVEVLLLTIRITELLAPCFPPKYPPSLSLSTSSSCARIYIARVDLYLLVVYCTALYVGPVVLLFRFSTELTGRYVFVVAGRGNVVTKHACGLSQKTWRRSRKLRRLLFSCRANVASLFLGALVQNTAFTLLSCNIHSSVCALARSSLRQR